MRVTSNNKPETVSVETYIGSTIAEVRLRENISEVTVFDQESQEEIQMYKYDEYILNVPYRDGLQDEIDGNLQDWLATGRTLEYNPNASAVADLASENAVYASKMAELDASYREGVNSV